MSHLIMNIYLVIILAALIGSYLLDLIADWLNVRNLKEELPAEFDGWYDAEKYKTSQKYLRERTAFGIGVDTFHALLYLALILTGAFNIVDLFARKLGMGPIPTGLIFAGTLGLILGIINLPFSVYSTFVIEQKYGFNRATVTTFVLDIIKSVFLSIIIGAPLFAAILWFFEKTGSLAWIYCWLATVLFQMIMLFIAPYVIMPLFNTFTPLQDGELRTAIEEYAKLQSFKMKGVFAMDGSKRSSKTNAFFTGFGKSRRIVLLDTLMTKHPTPELVAVVAHEMGHYKKKHILRAIGRAIATSGFTFFLMSLFIGNRGLFEAFRMEHISVYASLFFFGFLYSPISTVISIAENAISRRHEREADTFAVQTYGNPDAMIAALKRLSVDNLSNLTPHPFMVFLHYSHPPILDRIREIRVFCQSGKREVVII
jgi:STE24 endopeptidase